MGFSFGGGSAAGSTGQAGRTILNGSGAPDDVTDGVNGDFYIDTDTWDLYGPKAAGAWPVSTVNLNGPTGAAGADGNTILSGSGAPGGGTGADGDFYIDTDISKLYGPKAGGAWPAGVSLIGATGAQGDPGADGADGAAGPAGPVRCLMVRWVVPSNADTSSIHAQFRGDDASNDFPGPFADPDMPRNVAVAFGNNYDGGDVVIHGLDQFGNAISETISPPAPAGYEQSVHGVKCFASYTSATKTSVGVDADPNNYASIGVGALLGIVDPDVPQTATLQPKAVRFRSDGQWHAPTTVDPDNFTVDQSTVIDGVSDMYAILGLVP